MPRIVSGVPEQPQYDSGAVLRGFDRGTKARQERDQEQRLQAQSMLQFQQALVKTQMQRAKQLELLNQQAQMGNAQALQQMALEAQYGPKTPQEEQMQTLLTARSQIQDPKALATADDAIDRLGKHLKKTQEDKATLEAIKAGAADGLIDEATFMQRYDSGEQRDVLTKDIATARTERTVSELSAQKAEAVIAQSQAILDATPDSPRKLAAQYKLQEYRGSPTMQAKPGSDAAFLQDFQNTLIESDPARRTREREINARQLEARQPKAYQRMKNAREPDEEGMEAFRARRERFGPTDPKQVEEGAGPSPALKAFSAGRTAEKEKRYLGSTSKAGGQRSAPVDTRAATLEVIQSATDQADLVRQLKARGVKLTPSTIEEIKAAANEWRNSVASRSGADR